VTPPATTGGDGGTPGTGTTPVPNGPVAAYFPSTMYFNQPVDGAELDPQSSTIMSTLAANGGWGNGGALQVDTSIDVYYADATSLRVPYLTAAQVFTPDTDTPHTVPISPSTTAGSAAPGFEDLTSCASGDDCHYLVLDAANHQLVEIYGAVSDGKTMTTLADGRAAVIWDTTKSYPGSLRGDVCTSADASGALMAPLLFTADEVAAGHIDHAVRFILPNARIQTNEYVRPATHGTGGAKWAQTNGVPYGARFRLKASVDTSKLKAGAQVVAAALKKYGMILSDGGEIAFTARSDAHTTAKWATTMDPQDLASLKVSDFEMVQTTVGSDQESSATRHDFTSQNDSCVRNP
jgi:hypothetical protein